MILFRGFLLVVFAIVSVEASALCVERNKMIRQLKAKYGEVAAFRGLSGKDLVEVYLSPSGSYSITVTYARRVAVSCIIATGKAWSPSAQKSEPAT